MTALGPASLLTSSGGGATTWKNDASEGNLDEANGLGKLTAP